MYTSAKLTALTNYLKQYSITDVALVEQLNATMKEKQFTKRENVFKQGEPLQEIYFVPDGIVRYFVISEEGKEVTKAFRVGPTFISSTASMAKSISAPFTAEALQAITVHSIDINTWYKLLEDSLSFSKFYYSFLETLLIEKERHELRLLLNSPKQRYQQFLKQYKYYLNDIPQWMIATYLNITPETLSRLRKVIL